MLKESVVQDLENPKSQVSVYHELGHVHRYDWLLLRIYGLASLVFILAALRYALTAWWGGTAINVDQSGEAIRHGWMWAGMLCLIGILNLVGVRGVLHRREYYADHHARRHCGDAAISSLQRRLPENQPWPIEADTAKTAFLNAVFHPSSRQRLEAQTQKISAVESGGFRQSLIWSFSCLVTAYFALSPNFSLSLLNNVDFEDLGPVGLILILPLLIYLSVAALMIRRRRNFHRTDTRKSEIPAVNRGFACSFLLFALYIQSFFGVELNPLSTWNSHFHLVFISLITWFAIIVQAQDWHNGLNIENRLLPLKSVIAFFFATFLGFIFGNASDESPKSWWGQDASFTDYIMAFLLWGIIVALSALILLVLSIVINFVHKRII